jgi:hypothetical protein
MPPPMKAHSSLSLALVLTLAGCMAERVPLPRDHPGIPKQSSFLVKKIGYDEHGRPQFNERPGIRPRSAGETFAVVHTINDLPSRSYHIAIVEQPRTGPGPLKVIYTWTGKGFEGGVEITSGIFPKDGTIHSGAEAAAYLTIKAAPIVIGTVTGFVVGVLASIPETAKELKRVIVSTRETVIGITEYTYDDQGRIRFMKLYPPVEHSDALVRTEFFYEGASVIPKKAEVTSVVEQKIRQVP